MLKEKIGVIGAGKIGSAIARGVIGAGLAGRDRLMVSDVSEPLLKGIAAELRVKIAPSNAELCEFADIVILAVKPQIIDAVLKEIAEPVGKGKLVISVAAGVPLSRIESRLARGARVVRVMPNIACVVGAAASGYAGGTNAGAKDLERVGEILGSFGIGLPVEEKQLDAVTGLSGSGPAYVFLFIEALADGGVRMGLARDVALKLAVQTVYGAARMALESGRHLGQLRDEVTSPGGTTIAGLHTLEKGGIRGLIMEAVLQATRRSKELGEDKT